MGLQLGVRQIFLRRVKQSDNFSRRITVFSHAIAVFAGRKGRPV
jgi:hypothetical protein